MSRPVRGVLIQELPARGESKKSRRDDEELSDIEKFFASVGEGDRLKVYRMPGPEAPPGTQPAYLASWPFTKELASELDETLARELGGGRYKLLGYRDGTTITGGCAYRNVDETLYPPKGRPGGAAPAVPGMPVLPPAFENEIRSLRASIKELSDQNRVLSEQKAVAREDALVAVMRVQEQSTERMLAMFDKLVVGQRATAPAATGPSSVEHITSVVDLLAKLGYGPSGGAGANESLSLGERVLAAPLTAVGNKVGEAIAAQFSPAPKTTSPAASSPATPAAPAPAKPPATQPVSLPQGARPMTHEQFATMMQERARRQQERQRQRAITAPAPKARDATPNAPGATEK